MRIDPRCMLGAPVATLSCHYSDSQRSSGAPFASGFIVRVSDVTVIGTPKTVLGSCQQWQARDSQLLFQLRLSSVHAR
ncbi:hypothetical protein OKW26_000804 [Paraburkholderia sp. 32]